MSFKNASIEQNDSLFVKFKEGVTRLRIVSEEVEAWKLFENRKCIGVYTDPNKGRSVGAKQKFYMWVINRETEQVQILDAGSMIMGALQDLAKDDDYGFDALPPYDIKITRKGSELDTKYSVMNAPPTELTEADKELVRKTVAEKGSIQDMLTKEAAKYGGGNQEVRVEDIPF